MIRSLVRRARAALRPLLRRLAGDPAVALEEHRDCPQLFHSYRDMIETGHRRVPGGWVYDGEFYPDYLCVGGNARAIRRIASQWCRGRGLDVGAGFWPLQGSTPVDTGCGPGLANRIEDVPARSQDYVFSSHCLEHIAAWEAALDEWIAKVRPGGVVFLYLPHPSCGLWRVDNPLMRGVHLWQPTFPVVRAALEARKVTIVAGDEGPDDFFGFHLVGRTHG
jgi:SAM-dependent methyltransferase